MHQSEMLLSVTAKIPPGRINDWSYAISDEDIVVSKIALKD